jgi:hypothetical protein
MQMSKLFLFSCLAILSSVAPASTSFTFAAATDGSYRCSNPSLCVGFTASDDAYSVDSVNVGNTLGGGKSITIVINGVAYSGTGTAVGNSVQGVAVQSADGMSAIVDISYNSRRACTKSGRGQHCTTHTSTVSGSVSM